MTNVPRRHSFPIARRVWRFARTALANWRERHQNAFNFWIHLIGIPLTLAGIGLLFFFDWYWGAGAFVLGYVLQWVGHRVEGNDVGELIPIKRALGLPTIAVADRPALPTPLAPPP